MFRGSTNIPRQGLKVQQDKWADLMEKDPRRVVRALGITTPRGETIEGDTFGDLPHIYDKLRRLSTQSKSKVWRGLVDAGIVTAL